MPRIVSLELRVADLSRSEAFYRDFVGLELGMDDEGGPGQEHLEGWWPEVAGGDYMYLGIWRASEESPPSRIRIGFLVDDLERRHALAAEMGIVVRTEPVKRPWGLQAEYEDPDGNLISLTQS